MNNLESILEELARYGEVSLYSSTDFGPKVGGMRRHTWWVKLKLTIPSQGVSADVCSDLGKHTTPLEAAKECVSRLMELSRTAAQALPTLEG